jgi:hypothetical protein
MVFQSRVQSSLTETIILVLGSRIQLFRCFFTLIRVDFEIKFSVEQLSKIMKSDVDVAA